MWNALAGFAMGGIGSLLYLISKAHDPQRQANDLVDTVASQTIDAKRLNKPPKYLSDFMGELKKQVASALESTAKSGREVGEHTGREAAARDFRTSLRNQASMCDARAAASPEHEQEGWRVAARELRALAAVIRVDSDKESPDEQ